jgi:hypothetical protein
MSFNKEQRKAHYEANKELLRQKRRERYLAQKGQVEQIKNVLPEGEQNVLPKKIVLPKLEVEQKKQVGQNEGEQSKVEQIKNVLPNFVIPVEAVKPEQVEPQLVKPCPRCLELENSITNFYNLVLKEQEKTKEAQKTIQTQNKELTIKNQEKEKLLKELSEHKQIINNLQTKNNSLIQKYNKLENQIKNTDKPLTIPDLIQLISKHQKIQTIQHKYSDKDIREREFLKGLLDKLWIFD